MNKFWQQVGECKHEWSDIYLCYFACGTPYCNGSEYRCVKCKVYQAECLCGFETGISGWPRKRIIKHY